MTQEQKHLDLAAKYRRLQTGFINLAGQVPTATAVKTQQAARNCGNHAKRQVDEANQARMKPKELAQLGYLFNNQITPELLAQYPTLLDKASPDPELFGEILALVPVCGRGDCYRVRTGLDARYHGVAEVLYTLTEIRSRYVAMPT